MWNRVRVNAASGLSACALTEIHKATLVGRPIISGCDEPTERISAFVDTLLMPISISRLYRFHQFHWKDKDRKTNFVSMDFTSLYTNIPQEEGITTVRKHKGKSSLTGSGLFVWMSQWGNNNEFALQHGGFCTMWSFVAKGLLGVFKIWNGEMTKWRNGKMNPHMSEQVPEKTQINHWISEKENNCTWKWKIWGKFCIKTSYLVLLCGLSPSVCFL